MIAATDKELVARAAIDTLNSIQVLKGVASWRAQRPLTRRILDRVTGHARRLDVVFDEHTADALQGLQALVGILRDHVAGSDAVLQRVITTLISVRTLTSSHDSKIADLDAGLARLEERYRSDLVDFRRDLQFALADQEITRVLLRLEDPYRKAGLSLLDLWEVTDTLWWGKFGSVIRSAPDGTEAHELREHLLLRFRTTLDKLGYRASFEVGPLLANVSRHTSEDAEVFDLMALQPTWHTRAITRALVDRTKGTVSAADEELRIPVIANADLLIGKLLNEAQRGTDST